MEYGFATLELHGNTFQVNNLRIIEMFLMAQKHKEEWTLEKKQEHYDKYINEGFDRKKYDNEITQDLGISKTCTINNKLYGPRDSHNQEVTINILLSITFYLTPGQINYYNGLLMQKKIMF